MAAAGWHVEETQDAPVDVLIGMRWQSLWRLVARPWVPLAFGRMLLPAPGLQRTRFTVRASGPAVVQRWRDRSTVEAWARSDPHLQPWRRFAREEGGTAGWGIWHEVHEAP